MWKSESPYTNKDLFKSIPCHRYTLENMSIREERAPFWCGGVDRIDFIFRFGTPTIKWHGKVRPPFEECLEFFAPHGNLLGQMFRKKRRSVRDCKVRSKCKNKVDKKSAIHECPRERATNEHAEHEQLDLDFLLLTDLCWIHVGEDAYGFFAASFLRSPFIGTVWDGWLFGLSRHIIQLRWMCTLYQSLGDILMQNQKVDCKLLKISVKNFTTENMKSYVHYSP